MQTPLKKLGDVMHVERHPNTVRSVLLSLLMVSLAQTAYIGALQGWTYPVLEDTKSDVRPAGGVSEASSGGDVRLLLDPTTASSYGGSGTYFADLSGYNNNGTVSGATWDGSRYRFEMDGCTGSSAPFMCDDINIPNSQSLRPGPTDEDLAVTLMAPSSSTATYLLGPSTSAGYDLGKVTTSFTISAWVKPTDCDETTYWRHVIRRENSYAIGCKSDQWTVALGDGTVSSFTWDNTGVPAENGVWQHIALTRASSGSGVKFFLNGVEQYSVASYEGNLGTTDQILQLGTQSSQGATYTWRGEIDDLRIYTSDRSSTIADDMNEYPNVSDANLNAFFDFNQGRHGETLANGVGAFNLAAGTGASSADLSSVTGSPTVNRVWDVSTVGSDTVLTFKRTVLTASGGWKVPSGVTEVDYLVLAGGGGGGAHVGGGGGGGGMLTGTNSSVSGTVVPVQVGHGGRGGALLSPGSCGASCASDSRQAAVGGNSVFADVETTGGGSGGHWSYFSPSSGGSGGGGGSTTHGSGTGTGASRQGYDGGKGDGISTNGYLTGGGGGAGQWGENYSTGSTSGDGGPGQTSSITGTTATYGGGGGGGVHDSGGTAGSGGSGGGGNGVVATATQASSGTHGLGGGGGGSGGTSGSIASKGGDGGFGAVIVRYESVREHDWTVEVWFNASSQHTANTQTIFGTFATGGLAADNRYSARLKTNNSVWLNYRTDASSSVYNITTQPLDDDRWYHLVAVFRDDTNLSLYLDGQFVGDTSVSGSLLVSPNDLFIGSYSNAAGGQFYQGFDGQIGLTRIYGGALNGTEVSSNYNATKGVYDNTTEISYSTTTHEFTIGNSITSFTPSVANGSVFSYAISPSLPSGMSFGTSNGTVWGTPTALSSAADYTVYGNNSADSSTVTLNISINDVVPNALGYTPENMTLEKGTAMTTNTPSVSGGAVTSWEISPSLPSGLSFSTSTGAISGTPSVLQTTATTYTIWANNSGGSESAQVNITINDQVASISYSSPIEISNNRALSSTIAPTTSGGAITSWEITPSLPTGLTFGTTNGSIWGTPENVTSNATYTIYGNNSGGSASATLTLTIVWTLTPSAGGAYITRNSSIASDITWEWDYDPLEAQNLSLVTGEWNTCALDNNGNVFCWGRNGNGQIGNGQTGTAGCGSSGHKCKDTPTATNDLGSDVISLAFGHQHGCGLLDTGVVKCWGRNNNGQLGTSGGDKNTPQTVNLGSGRTATSIYAGGHSTCAILDDASVKCWGNNDKGQLGIGSSSLSTSTPTTISSLGTGRTAVSLATAFNAVCALLDDGYVKCWGSDDKGQLGNGGSNSGITSPPASAINLGTGRTAKAITGGEFHFCAILDDDSIKCWGEGDDGKLGTGSTGIRNTPTSTSGSFASGRYAVAIDAGYDHTCAILDNGQLTCWGSDADGQLGNGATTGTKSSLQSSTVSLGTGRTAISLSAGGEHTCAQLDNGQLKCWGNRADGQVGDNGNFNNPSDRTSPSSVSSNNHGGSTYLNTGVMPSSAVTGATCAISPSLPTGLSLTAGTCTITGTPTATATNATYTIWANVSGQSFSGQIWLEVGLNAPDISYSSSSYVYTKDIEITTLTPSNVGGEVTTWAINATLPSGLTFETSNGTIWGTPTVELSLTTYTVWANNSVGSSSTTVNITIGPMVPGPFEYNPENNTLTNNTEVHLAPQFINQTTGNGSTWQVADIFSGSSGSYPGREMAILVGDTMYFDAYDYNYGIELWAHDTSNASTWRVTDIRSSGFGDGSPGDDGLAILVGDTLYFNANDGSSGFELWAHDTSNASTWRVADINSGSGDSDPGYYMSMLVGDTLYFSADDGSSGTELWAHDTSNASTWRVADIWSGASNSNPGDWMAMLVGDTLYFSAWDGSSGHELWAHDTSNASTWRVADINSGTGHSFPGRYMSILVGDTLYFDAEDGGSSGRELWAHDTSNASTWQVADIRSGASSFPGSLISMLVGDTLYFDATDGSSRELWAHDTSNSSTWRVTDINSGTGNSFPGYYAMAILVGDTLYFSADDGSSGIELWAHDTSNASTWRVADINSGTGSSNPYTFPETLVGDTLYFGAKDGSSIFYKLWAHDTSNASTWEVDDIRNPGGSMSILVGDTLYFNGGHHQDYIGSGQELWAHRPSTIGYNTNTGGNVTSWAINASLPSGLTFSTTNGSIYGTPTELWTQTSYMVWANNSGGQSVAYLNITVVDELPTLSYSPENLTLTKGQSSTDLPLSATLTGSGTITSWAISPALPSGLSFGTSNGTIWGIPTVLQTTAVTYTIYANNSGGSSVGYLNITVVDQVPTGISYSPENVTLTNNTVSSDLPLAPSITGSGTITSWELNNSNLPSGISFGSSNGTLYGTGTQLWTTTAYKVWANNSGGSVIAYFNLTVNDQVPTLSYSPKNLTLTKNQTSSDLPLNATLTGSGAIISWAISPALPTGLTFSTSNGTIWGIPTVLQTTAVTYTIWANNSGGSVNATVNITVNDVAPDISYNPDWFVLTNNTAMSPTATPTNAGGAIPSGIIAEPLQVGSSYGEGRSTSIAVDSNGVAHVVYFGGYHYQTLYYATNANGSWVTTVIKNQYGISSGASIVIDANDTIHISYSHRASRFSMSNNLYYSTCSSSCSSASSWSGVLVESGSGLHNDIAIDTNGTLHISYRGSTNTNLKYATCSSSCSTASSWTTTSITSVNVVSSISMTTDSNNSIHILYREGYGYPTFDLNYATCSSGCTSASSWSTVEIDASTTSSYMSKQSIAVDSNNVIHITYGLNGNLTYATCSSSCTSASSWTNTTVDTGSFNGVGEIALDSNEHLYISYGKGSSFAASKLAYATCSSSCTSSSSWTNTTFNTTAGTERGLALDSNDRVHISYHTSSTDKLLRYLAIEPSSIVYGYSISPALPAGLSLEISTGEISGTPTELSANTTYTITVRNSGGVNTTTITIEVVDQVPTVAYSPADLTLTNNTVSSDLPLSPTITGSGEITSWELNASLPSGLTFETSNGTIWGTPTELWTQTSYMVWANNSGGQSVAYLNITVVDELPTLSYSPENLTLTNNTASTDLPLSPTITGSGTITSWAINGTLPAGLNFSTSNGTLYGTPTELWNTTAYMVWANNSGGSVVAYLNITVNDQVPTSVAYSPADLTLTNNTVSSDLPLVPTITGSGEITSWELNNTSLPSGISFGSNNGTLYGTPTELWNTTAYMVWANNSGGSVVAYLNITVNDQVPTSVTYTPENLTLVRGETSTDLPLVPAITGPGDITSWAINASLPTGLSFGTNNGTVWGVPLVNMSTTAYTVWANNSGGSVSTTLNITVLEPVVMLDYNPENLTLIRGVQMATLTPSVSGGNVSEWAISPVLPAGLNFSGGVISGTPTVNMTTMMFTVYANTSGGSTSHTLNITILEPSGNLSYSPENITLTRGLAMSDLHPTYSGGSIENWSIHPALPAGLNFSNGVISGTPTVNMTTMMYTVYANNSGGSAAATINITILEPVVDLLYSPDNLTLMRGTTMTPLLPSVSGGNASEWGLVGVLPEGLNFSNGVFSGTPLVNMTQTQYLVYANTSGGSATAWVNITVLEPAVDLSYNPYNITLVRNVSMTPLSPTVSGGNVSNWSISPALPAGLNFTNGMISGTPEVNMTTTMFTVWANTSGGAASATVNITIVEPLVDFLYNPNTIVLTRNETMNATPPVFGNDAMAEEWGISPALPEGLNFTNGTISGTPLVNMTATVFTVYANNSGGSAAAYLTITILEPVATVVYVPENITLTRGEDNTSIVPILGGGMAALWSISPALPEGLVFDNGTITGVPLVNSTNTTYTVIALNSGGMAFAFLNITVLEPVAILAFNESFVVTRGEDLLNHSVNNTGGMVATWEIEPALPFGITMENGVLFGISEVNLTVTTYTLWANNSGGSANISFTLEVLEPKAEITYATEEFTLVNGISRALIIPTVEGGVPEYWSIEPALPAGLVFVNGYVVGIPMSDLTTTTFTVYANNSGGTANSNFTLTVNQPTYFARYPVTRIVLNVNETLEPLEPLYYFGANREPLWAISPGLPAGLFFENGSLFGTPTEASNLTNYTIVVTGEMLPVEFYLLLEVREEVPDVVEIIRNETELSEFVLPEGEEDEDSFTMFWICPPLIFIILILTAAAINNYLALTSKDEDDEDDEEGEDDEGEAFSS